MPFAVNSRSSIFRLSETTARCHYVGAVLPRKSISLHAILLAAVSLTAATLSCAQVIDFDKERSRIVACHGLWRFHTGDDPGWADPNFDDSNWPVLRSDRSWSVQGYRGYSGIAWYRFKVVVPADLNELLIYVPLMVTSYQLFVDGQQSGQFGGMPPHHKVIRGGNQVFPIRIEPSRSQRTLTIAFRIWQWSEDAGQTGGGPLDAIEIGDQGSIDQVRRDDHYWTFWFLAATNVQLLIGILSGIAGLSLFALRPTDREYLWFGAFELFAALDGLKAVWLSFYTMSLPVAQVISNCAEAFSYACFIAFLFRILGSKTDRLYWVAMTAIVLQFSTTLPTVLGWVSYSDAGTAWLLGYFPYYAIILFFLFRAARRRRLDALLLLVPVALAYLTHAVLYCLLVMQDFGGKIPSYFGWVFEVSRWPFPFSATDLASLLMQLSILAILLMRFSRTRRDEQRMATELEAARTVQSVLIPAEIPAIPGFAIASIYKPANQVGGDFFQIIPARSGGFLAVIGDVSGKGMPAAMTVSLLVGTVRTLAHYTPNPGEILAAMNQRMLARSAGGFTTCLVLRAESDGSLTVANAGHIAPYLNGKELPLENGLPLGLAADSIYIESTFHLAEVEQLTLMTDGVVEARSKSGELFGFERTRAVATKSAESIAQAALDFGQEDDVTVVTLVRTPVGEESITHDSMTVLSPSPA